MIKFKYLFEKNNRKDIWVCESCRKAHNRQILRGEWKLIGRCRDNGILCSKCTMGEKASYEYLVN